MIFDLARNETLPDYAADVCIVGAGAAGIVLAVELVRQGRRVLLLESGGAIVEPEAQALNACEYNGQPHREANIGRFRALGGTTTAWGGQVLELDAEDFALRPWVPGSGWPFAKSTLQPYYERALNMEGLSQAIRDDREVWSRIKAAKPDLDGALEPYFTRWCPESNFARLHREAFPLPNLCVVLHATATALILEQDGTRIAGIQCRTIGGKERTFIAAQYVLCLGAIECVRFLLQPLPGGHAPVWNRSGMLGSHFQSHIDCDTASVPLEDAPKLRRWFANAYLGGFKYHPKFRLAFPVQREEKLLNIAGSITCINQAEPELVRIKFLMNQAIRGKFFGATLKDLPLFARRLPEMLRLGYGYAIERRAHWPSNSSFRLRVHCEQEPLSRSSVTLTNTRDATGLFGARLDWRVSPLEWKTIGRFTEHVECTFATQGLADIEIRPEVTREDGFHDVVFDNSHHDMGGTRMAESPAEGVVDPQLRLHGIENGYVCSASVFPSSGFSNPTHTLIALAIRLADRLSVSKKTLSSRPESESPNDAGGMEGSAVSRSGSETGKGIVHA